MKKLLLISVLFGLLPLSMAAQVDDLYFVPKKKSATKVTDSQSLPRDVYYSGSNRSIDEYNRRVGAYDLAAQDSTLNDTIYFSAEKGVFPDSTSTEDFELTKQMSRFDDYSIADNDAFWAGYAAGRYDWGWHSPWYYSRFGWYDPWYTPWYYGGWYWSDPWFYSSYYGWYGYYHNWYGYYPYYSYYYPVVGGGHHYTTTGHSGTINLRGGSRVMSHGSGAVRNGGGRLVGTNRGIERSDRLRNRTVGTSRTTSGNRSSATRNNGNFNGGSRMGMNSGSSSSSRSSYSGGGGGGASRSSSGGGFSGGGGGGSRGGRR